MAEMRAYIVGVLIAIVIMGGFYSVFNDYYAQMGSPATLSTTAVNSTRCSLYVNGWSNQTSALIANAQAFPILGGSVGVFSVGVYQALSLTAGFPQGCIIPFYTDITSGPNAPLPLPLWFSIPVGVIILFTLIWSVMRMFK